MSNFVQIQERRIRKSVIQKYYPTGILQLNVYYSASRNKIDVEIFTFTTIEERDAVLYYLDNEL